MIHYLEENVTSEMDDGQALQKLSILIHNGGYLLQLISFIRSLTPRNL